VVIVYDLFARGLEGHWRRLEITCVGSFVLGTDVTEVGIGFGSLVVQRPYSLLITREAALIFVRECELVLIEKVVK